MKTNKEEEMLLDIESEWERVGTTGHSIVYKHKRCEHFYRVIDIAEMAVIFVDTNRITNDRIIDIDKKLPEERKTELRENLLASLMAAEKPIEMPYTPEHLKVYIEDLGDVTGVLYYMDCDDDKSLVAIKRFFREDICGDRKLYAEISFDDYQKIKEEKEDVGDEPAEDRNCEPEPSN